MGRRRLWWVLAFILTVACGGTSTTSVATSPASDADAWAALCRDLPAILPARTGMGWDEDSLATLESDADRFEEAGDAETSAKVRSLVAAMRDASVASQVNVYFTDPIDREVADQVMEELRANEDVVEVSFQSKAAAWERFLRLFANQPDLIQAADPAVLPASVRALLAPGIDGDPIAARYLDRQGVRDAVADAPDEDAIRVMTATGFTTGACSTQG